ncbi:MAG: hypothetical protein J6U65_01075 [Bacteroidaceae bacterium]|nr:hypothetical protein [Bacteroidaceae bacterium]MBO7293989.1 hypothetical protein [Bacteroidaceae bacterium]
MKKNSVAWLKKPKIKKIRRLDALRQRQLPVMHGRSARGHVEARKWSAIPIVKTPITVVKKTTSLVVKIISNII